MNLKILIAEDEADVRDIMKKWICSEGYDAVTASDGQEAWDKIKSESPDIIILDLIMPKLHGLEVLKKVRENPHPDKWQPVIIISALGQMEDMKKGFALEADHYITKPCQMDTVMKAIRIMASLIPQRKSSEPQPHSQNVQGLHS